MELGPIVQEIAGGPADALAERSVDVPGRATLGGDCSPCKIGVLPGALVAVFRRQRARCLWLSIGASVDLSWWEFALWGAFGGFIVDGLDFYRAVRRNAGKWPLPWRRSAFLIAEVIRLAIGSGLATALGVAGQASGPVGAIAIGAAAPILVEKLAHGDTNV